MDNVKYKYRKNQSFWGLIFFMISFDFFMIFLILHSHFFASKNETPSEGIVSSVGAFEFALKEVRFFYEKRRTFF